MQSECEQLGGKARIANSSATECKLAKKTIPIVANATVNEALGVDASFCQSCYWPSYPR
jgi:hypothetical protein